MEHTEGCVTSRTTFLKTSAGCLRSPVTVKHSVKVALLECMQWKQVHRGGRWGGVGGLGEVDFEKSLGLIYAIPVHKVFKLGGKICHNSRSSQVKCPLEVFLVVQHPNVHLKSDATLIQLKHRVKNASVLLMAVFKTTLAYFCRNLGHLPVTALTAATTNSSLREDGMLFHTVTKSQFFIST